MPAQSQPNAVLFIGGERVAEIVKLTVPQPEYSRDGLFLHTPALKIQIRSAVVEDLLMLYSKANMVLSWTLHFSEGQLEFPGYLKSLDDTGWLEIQPMEPLVFVSTESLSSAQCGEEDREELTLDALRELCAGAGTDGAIQLTSEGGFRMLPSRN